MATETLEVKKYELLMILAPDMPEKERGEVFEEIKKHIQENSKGIRFEDVWGIRPLAYRMKKFSEGHYAVLYFEAAPENIAEIRTNVKLQPRVLRHLLLTLPEKYEPRSLSQIEAETPKIERKPRVAEKRREKKPAPVAFEATPKAAEILPGKADEEKLKQLDKTLEKILENPDIEIK